MIFNSLSDKFDGFFTSRGIFAIDKDALNECSNFPDKGGLLKFLLRNKANRIAESSEVKHVEPIYVIGGNNRRVNRLSLKLLLNRKYAPQKEIYEFDDGFFDNSAHFLPILNE